MTERSDAPISLRRNIAWLLVAHVSYVLTAFLVVVVVSRTLGPEPLGAWRFAQAILAIGIVLTDAGLTQAAIRDVATAGGVLEGYVRRMVGIRLALTAGFIVAVAASLIGGAAEQGRIILVAVIALVPAALSLVHILQGMQRQADVAKTRLLTQVGGGIVGLVAVLATKDVVALLLPPIVFGLVADIWIYRRVQRLPRAASRSMGPSTWLGLARAGAPFLSAALAIQIVTSADALLIGVLLGAVPLGLYTAAYVIAGQLQYLSGPVATALYPRLASEPGSQDRGRVLSDVLAIIGVAAWPVCIAIALAAPDVVRLLYPAAYREASIVLAVLMGMPLLGFYNVMVAQILNAAGKQALVMRVAWLAVVVNVGLNLILLPRIGIVGGALAAVATEAVTFTAYTWAVRDRYGFGPLAAYVVSAPSAIGAAALGMAVRAAGLPLIVSLLAGLAVLVAAYRIRPTGGYRALRAIMRTRSMDRR